MSAMRPLSTRTAPFGQARNAPNSGASIRKPRRPNRLISLINRRRYEIILPGGGATPQLAATSEKKIRAAHAKEKQQIRKTCNRPNRLNLLIWTAGSVRRSNLFTIFSDAAKTNSGNALQLQLGLARGRDPGGFFLYLLEQRFEFASLEFPDQGWVIRPDLQIVDRHRQFHMAIEFHNFPVLLDLLARVDQFHSHLVAFHLVDLGEQIIEPAEFIDQRGRGLATQTTDAGNVVDRIAGQCEHVADHLRRHAPLRR